VYVRLSHRLDGHDDELGSLSTLKEENVQDRFPWSVVAAKVGGEFIMSMRRAIRERQMSV